MVVAGKGDGRGSWFRRSVRLAIPARVVMGTWGISPFILKFWNGVACGVFSSGASCHYFPFPKLWANRRLNPSGGRGRCGERL